ncbi:MAG: hypothetical protein OHK0026_05750 [Rhodocyclaceae bacterium]
MRKNKLLLSCTLGLCAAAMAQADDRLTLTTGIDYSTGKYGGAASTDILYVPLIGKYETGPWTLKLTVPWLQITGPGNVVGSGDGVIVSGGSASTVRTRQSGMGDVVAAAGYALLGGRRGLALDITGKVKFATGDSAKGLSTGENDYALQTDLFLPSGTVTPFGTLGYKVIGRPAGTALRNVWYASAGASWKLSGATSAGALVDMRQASRPGAEGGRELSLYASRKLGASFKLQAYLSRGFSDTSADWGAGLMLGYGI